MKRQRRSYTEKKEISAEKIKEKLGLPAPPEFAVSLRPISDYKDKEGLARFEQEGKIVVKPEGYYGGFPDFRGLFREEFIQLSHDLNEDFGLRIHLLKLGIKTPEMDEDVAYKWMASGLLKNGEKFFTVIFLSVKRDYCQCNVLNIMKHEEVKFARQLKCDYIQAIIDADNPHFNKVIIPSLKQGFIFHHGSSNGGEMYEEEGYIHIRKYLKAPDNKASRVSFSDGAVFDSPGQNREIIKHLLSFKGYPGESVTKVTNLDG